MRLEGNTTKEQDKYNPPKGGKISFVAVKKKKKLPAFQLLHMTNAAPWWIKPLGRIIQTKHNSGLSKQRPK